MPPYTVVSETISKENSGEKVTCDEFVQDYSYRTLWGRFKMPLIWGNIIGLTVFHIIGIYGFIIYDYRNKMKLFMWYYFIGCTAGFGTTAGAHRLWSHRSYKAKPALRIILVILYVMTGQNRLFDWVRDHRVHHKFSETDADPHNANRGFFFSHVGWLMMKKHPEVVKKGKMLDFSDLWEDQVFCFIEKYYWPMKLFWCFIAPVVIPCFWWNESLSYSFFVNLLRLMVLLNLTWLVNSAAHLYGNRPFDKEIGPRENAFVSYVAIGEGWHNYHHTFPWDYKASDLGIRFLNGTVVTLDVFRYFGLVYDVKTASSSLVQKYTQQRGDGTYKSKVN